VLANEVNETVFGLKPRHILIKLHPANAFGFQRNLFLEYFGDVLRDYSGGCVFNLNESLIAQRSNTGASGALPDYLAPATARWSEARPR
jgi:hypothetical protein